VKIFSYEKGDYEKDDGQLREIEFMYLKASPNTLRKLSRFLFEVAKSLEENSEFFDGVHLRYAWKGWREGYPDIEVIRPDKEDWPEMKELSLEPYVGPYKRIRFD
jgi:hypothetical protein